MEDFFPYSLHFTDFKLSFEEKLKFEEILVQNLSDAGLFKKNIGFSWRMVEYLKDLLQFYFSKIFLRLFFCFSFLGLELFLNVQKKLGSIVPAVGAIAAV